MTSDKFIIYGYQIKFGRLKGTFVYIGKTCRPYQRIKAHNKYYPDSHYKFIILEKDLESQEARLMEELHIKDKWPTDNTQCKRWRGK